MKLLRLIAALFAVALFSAHAAEKPVHLFILTGQSNMAGMKPELGFMPEAKVSFPDAEVAFIKVAKGGRPIRDWVAEWDEIAKKNGIDVAKARAKDAEKGTPFYDQIITQLTALLEKHPQPASVTFCWMQGENDARFKLDAAYADALKQLISNLRRDLKQPEMKVVIGRICDYGKPDDKAWQAVRKIQEDITKGDSNVLIITHVRLQSTTRGTQKRHVRLGMGRHWLRNHSYHWRDCDRAGDWLLQQKGRSIFQGDAGESRAQVC
jgi:hypothetical protein